MVLLAPLFVGLGIWQLDRADQKRAIAHNLEVRRKLPPLPLGGRAPPADQLEFRKVSARGRFLTDRTVLIENRKHQGKTGFHVITPMRLTNSDQIVLVNRGWIAGQRSTQQINIPQPQEELSIEGEVSIPQPPALELSLSAQETETPPHWPFLTLEHFTAWSGLQVLPFLILQAPDTSDDFVRQWPEPRANDAMHIGYAVQWFAFALITLLIWLRLCFQKPTEQTPC